MFIHRQIKLGVNQAAELRQIKEKMAEAKYGLGQVSLESGKCPKTCPTLGDKFDFNTNITTQKKDISLLKCYIFT